MTTSNQPGQPGDRLHREVDEILEESRSRPISFQQRVEQKRNALHHHRRSTQPQLRQVFDRAVRLFMKVPIVSAVVLAIIAAYLAPEFGILATLFAIAAIVMVFIPFAGRRQSTSLPDQTRWRGRVVSRMPPASNRQPRTWLDHIRRRFNR